MRLHFHRYVKNLEEADLSKAQLGLAHSYSRSKVKFNVNRQDNMIIQSIALLDTLDKVTRTHIRTRTCTRIHISTHTYSNMHRHARTRTHTHRHSQDPRELVQRCDNPGHCTACAAVCPWHWDTHTLPLSPVATVSLSASLSVTCMLTACIRNPLALPIGLFLAFGPFYGLHVDLALSQACRRHTERYMPMRQVCPASFCRKSRYTPCWSRSGMNGTSL